MPVARRFAYLDHAATAPISGPASEAVQAWLRQAAELGGAAWPEWEESVNQVRRTAADLIGAAPEEVALVPNTTAGINLVAGGVSLARGRQCRDAGQRVPIEPVPVDEPGQPRRRGPPGAGGGRTRRSGSAWPTPATGGRGSSSVSWIGYASGWRMDLEALVALAHERRSAGVPGRHPGTRGLSHPRSAAWGSTFWRPTGTSGCWVRKARGCFSFAASICPCCGR